MRGIDERIRAAVDHWQLTVGVQLVGGTDSAVFAVTDVLGHDLVLKFPASRTAGKHAAEAEAAALACWADTGAAVTLVDATSDSLLLVRSRPGTPLPWQRTVPLKETVEMAGELLRRLWSASPCSYPFRTLAEVYRDDERVAREDAAFEQRQRGEPDRGQPGLELLPAAATSAEQLMATASESTLLHGDFISKNLVSDEASPVGWVALDPLPMMGDPAAEVGAFAAYNATELIMPIAEALAEEVRLDPLRALRWTAIWTVHQAAQAWRHDQHLLEGLVVTPMIHQLLRG